MTLAWTMHEIDYPVGLPATVRAFGEAYEIAWLDSGADDDSAALNRPRHEEGRQRDDVRGGVRLRPSPNPSLPGRGVSAARPDNAAGSDNAAGPDNAARFSIVCREPIAVLEQFDGCDATLRIRGRVVDSDENGWRLWRRAAARVPAAPAGPCGLTPGWIGYVGFEMAWLLERLPASHREGLGLPLLRMALFDRAVALDHASRRAFVVVCDGVRESLGLSGSPLDGLAEAWAASQRRGEALSGGVAGRHPNTPLPLGGEDGRGRGARERSPVAQPFPGREGSLGIGPEGPRLLMARDDYLRMIERALEYIAAGDIYQVNLAQRMRFSGVGDPLAAYVKLRRANPAPYAALLRWPGGAVGSLSPELFLRKRGGGVLTCPIKGTTPRTGDPVLDDAYRRTLLDSEKDAAELAMIVDLHRNDLGRVCEYGSVRVADARRVEAHPTVFHTVADVTGRLRPERDALDLLAACFPAGSISGVPKIRAMEIIDELEPAARGVYTGAVGVLGLDGAMTFNVAIRTLQFHRDQATLYVGGGIVADSDPADEYDETLAKARGVVEGMMGVSGRLRAAR